MTQTQTDHAFPWAPVLALLMALLLAACSGPSGTGGGDDWSSGGGGGYYENDGPPSEKLDPNKIPDAHPRVEPIHRQSTQPYKVRGKSYRPIGIDAPFRQTGVASWYGKQFHGRKTSIGERYNMYAMSAAHPTMPLPSYARVTNLSNGRSVVVRVNDRGPFLNNRIIDLSYAAATKLGYIKKGTARVLVERLTSEEIRSGSWRHKGKSTRTAASPAKAPMKVASAAQPASRPPISDRELQAAANEPQGTPTQVPVRIDADVFVGPAWGAQVGLFSTEDRAASLAEKIARELGNDNPGIQIIQVERGWRVFVGSFDNREQARTYAADLEERLHRGAFPARIR